MEQEIYIRPYDVRAWAGEARTISPALKTVARIIESAGSDAGVALAGLESGGPARSFAGIWSDVTSDIGAALYGTAENLAATAAAVTGTDAENAVHLRDAGETVVRTPVNLGSTWARGVR